MVDPIFKEQFEIAKPTARYAALLASLPDVFVGPLEHVIPLVSFLCSEIAAAFREEGALLPPWRQASSMLSKWRPRSSLEERSASPSTSRGESWRHVTVQTVPL